MQLLELSDCFDCSELVACVDRHAEDVEIKETARDLGWVGFQLSAEWQDQSLISDSWLFFNMDV